jgi:hypothetical protein
MPSENSPKINWKPLPPVNYVEYSTRVGWLNFIVIPLYLYNFVIIFNGILVENFGQTLPMAYFEITVYFLCSVGLFFSGVFLLRKKRLGKPLLQIVALLGFLMICVFGIWSLKFFWISHYSEYPLSVFGNFVRLIFRYLLHFSYPIVISIILTRKSDEELGLI